MTATANGRGQREPPQAIFERINRRRAARRTPAASAVPAPPATTPVRSDELVEPGPVTDGGPPFPEEVMPDAFPRSATMRALLRHPAVAVGVGVPAAVLLLMNPAARRLFQAGLLLGSRPEVRAVVGAALAAAGNAIEGRWQRTAAPGGERPMAPDAPGTAEPPQS